MEISGSRRTSLLALRSAETKRLRTSAIPLPSIAACKTAAELLMYRTAMYRHE